MFKYSEYIYYLMYIVGFAIMMIFNLKEYKNFELKKGKVVTYTLLTYVCGVAGAMIMGKFYTYYAHINGLSDNSRVAIFGAVVFTPLFLSIILKLFKEDVRGYMDILTPGIYIILTCAKLGCFFDGCCAGRPWSHGIYNPRLDMKVFPVQICEVISMIILIVVTQKLFDNKKWYKKGMAYPITAASYCVIRFCWEFARYYSNDVLGKALLGLTFWQVWCVCVFAVCVLVVWGIKKYQPIEAKKVTNKNNKNNKSKKKHKK